MYCTWVIHNLLVGMLHQAQKHVRIQMTVVGRLKMIRGWGLLHPSPGESNLLSGVRKNVAIENPVYMMYTHIYIYIYLYYNIYIYIYVL